MGVEDGKAFARICDFLFKKLALPPSDRVWFLDAAVSVTLLRDLPDAPAETSYDASMRRVQVVAYREVVESLEDPVTEIALAQARGIDRECEPGDQLDVPTPVRLSAEGRSRTPYDLPDWVNGRWTDEQVIEYLAECLEIT